MQTVTFTLSRSCRLILVAIALTSISLQAMADSPSQSPLSAGQSASAEPILEYYPASAKAEGTNGSAVIKCGRTQHGGFEHCLMISESPANSGFGAAALAITAHAAQGCFTLTDQQRIPKEWTFNFTTSPLSINPDVVKPGWMIEPPTWQRMPSYDELRAAYPGTSHGSGHTVLACKADDKGALVDCKIAEESPPGQGFGLAALNLAHAYAMKTHTCDGRPTAGAVIVVPINWGAPAD